MVKVLYFLNIVVYCILRGEIFFWRRKKRRKRRKRRKMFGEDKCIFWRRRKMEKKRDKNIKEKENISKMDEWTKGRKEHQRFYKGHKKSTARISNSLLLLFLAP